MQLTGNLEIGLPLAWVDFLEAVQCHHEKLDLLLIFRVTAPFVNVLANRNLSIRSLLSLPGSPDRDTGDGVVTPILCARHSCRYTLRTMV